MRDLTIAVPAQQVSWSGSRVIVLDRAGHVRLIDPSGRRQDLTLDLERESATSAVGIANHVLVTYMSPGATSWFGPGKVHAYRDFPDEDLFDARPGPSAATVVAVRRGARPWHTPHLLELEPSGRFERLGGAWPDFVNHTAASRPERELLLLADMRGSRCVYSSTRQQAITPTDLHVTELHAEGPAVLVAAASDSEPSAVYRVGPQGVTRLTGTLRRNRGLTGRGLKNAGSAARTDGASPGGPPHLRLLVPQRQSPVSLHTVLVLHGGPYASLSLAYPSAWHEVRELLRHGVRVALLDPQGSRGYGPKTGRLPLHEWGRTDLKQIVDLLPTLGEAEALGVLGMSYGGYLAARLAEDALVARAVLSRPETDLAALEPLQRPLMAAAATRRPPWVAQLPRPAGDPAVPTLCLHGTADRKVPHDQSERLQPTAQVVLFPGCGHDLSAWPHEDRMAHANLTVQFLTREQPCL